MPLAISICYLRDTIIKRLEAKYSSPLPANIKLPCEEWIRLQFWPTNPTLSAAMHYTGQFNINFKSKLDYYVKIIQMHIIVLVYFVIYASLLYILYHNHVC